jgi:DNA polymerase I-like protein with 3'-5' exonuclease and polymerase domains/intein/homing endonuclease
MYRIVFHYSWSPHYDVKAGLDKLVTKTLAQFGDKPQTRYEKFSGALYVPKPDEIALCFGKTVLEAMGMAGLVRKKATISSTRGVLYQLKDQTVPSGWYLVTFPPELVALDPAMPDQIGWDIRLAERFARTGGLLPEVGTYRWVMDFTDLIASVNAKFELTGKPVEVAGDSETLGLHPFNGAQLVSLGFTDREGFADCVYVKDITTEEQATKLMADLDWLLTSPRVKTMGANFKFDLTWFGVAWKRFCTNFTFDSLIAGSMIDENRSNSLTNHACIYTTMGGYDCVSPDTRLLTADLQWKPAGEVKEGDELVGFDEEVPQHGHRRRMAVSIVEATTRTVKPGALVHLEDGRVIKCSQNHSFLSKLSSQNGPLVWREACQLKPAHCIASPIPVEEFSDTHNAGWMAGFLDGEGYISGLPGLQLGWSQKPGPEHERARAYCTSLGLRFGQSDKAICGVCTTKMGANSAFKMLQVVRPGRLLRKRKWAGLSVPAGTVKVVKVELTHDIEVVALQTSTRTFIAEGLASHNCEFNTKYDKSRMDLVPKADVLQYMGGDIDAVFRVCRKIKAEMMDVPGIAHLYVNIIHPASRVFEGIERRGVLADRGKFEELRCELEGKHGNGGVLHDLTKRALQLMPLRLRGKYQDNLTLRPALLKDYFFSPLGLNLKPQMYTAVAKEASTAKAHLAMFHTVPEAKEMVDILDHLSVVEKMLGTYVKGFLEHLRSDDRFHPSYMFFVGRMFDNDDDDSGAKTGRLSAKDPAAQCMVGETAVLTSEGKTPLIDIVRRYEAGERFKVLTHTGAWRSVVGVYRNGKKEALRIVFSNGYSICCTANHPVLTDAGFVRTDALRVGDKAYAMEGASEENTRTPVRERGQSNTHVPSVVEHDNAVLQHESEIVPGLRGAGHRGVRELEGTHSVSGGYGGVPCGNDAGTSRRERAVRTGELLVGTRIGSKSKQAQQPQTDISGRDTVRVRVGAHYGVGGPATSSFSEGVAHGESPDDALAAHEAGFSLAEIVSIVPVGPRETYDLTIDACHSFVADGIVVHNTIPKHWKDKSRPDWATKLRLCFPAPPGYAMFSTDCAQGELKLAACIAEEDAMLAAYLNNLDLHAVTGAAMMLMEYADFIKMKESDPGTFDLGRFKAKAANFGLLYTMQAAGFVRYAWANFKMSLTEKDAQDIIDRFFGLYPKLLKWHERYINMAHRDGYVTSPFGRVRHLPLIGSRDWKIRGKAERMAINSPIQGSLSEITLWAMTEIDKQVPEAQLCLNIHDAAIGYLPEDRAEELGRKIADVAGNLPIEEMTGWKPQLKFNFDLELGPTMGSLKKIKLAA